MPINWRETGGRDSLRVWGSGGLPEVGEEMVWSGIFKVATTGKHWEIFQQSVLTNGNCLAVDFVSPTSKISIALLYHLQVNRERITECLAIIQSLQALRQRKQNDSATKSLTSSELLSQAICLSVRMYNILYQFTCKCSSRSFKLLFCFSVGRISLLLPSTLKISSSTNAQLNPTN